ncbi:MULTISPECIES: DUF6318 family protein [Arthrobacter]|uniref:DUF6318 domain-containing protein n=1 Tax=Arthrobacter terricola TaxID=2547396 RepID=A0A4R5KJL3_9MICC|nr:MULTISPECIES: DUF6318 family protein [Arthrobacter]MBT8161675.1 hypothetical protein [Arthrobacter sp. GN70]TDF95332.1 hypothetical protein E1809_12550 [Arthrobacter terricola]
MNSSTSISFRARFFAIAVVGVMLGLTGCAPGDPPEASQTGRSSASPSVTATPTPTPVAAYKPATSTGRAENVPVPVLPEAAKANSKEGLEAFARYWYQVLSYAYETGDLTDVQRLSGPNCGLCANQEKAIAAAWSDGKWIVGGRIETPLVEGKTEEGKSSQVTVQAIQQLIEIRSADGSLFQEPTEASNMAMLVVAAFGPNGWTLIDFGLVY